MINDNVLLLGANGFIGKNMINFLSDAGYIVHALDKSDILFGGNNVISVNISISETVDLKNYINEKNIKIVIHLVSGMLASSPACDFYKEMNDIIIPTFHLIDALCDLNVKFVYFSSGGTIYGESEQLTLKEEVLCHPTSYYGYSKLIIEEYLRLANKKNNLLYLILRPSNPYGRFQNPKKKQGFIAVALDKIINNESIEIWGDGSVIRDYIYIDDLCSILVDLLKNNIINMTLNVGSGVGHSLIEITKALAYVSGKEISIVFKDARQVDISKTVLDIKKLKSVVDFKPTSILDGIQLYYENLQMNGD